MKVGKILHNISQYLAKVFLVLQFWFVTKFRCHELFPNETIPNVKITNPENGNIPKRNNPKMALLATYPDLT
jgi:hypothetical protein